MDLTNTTKLKILQENPRGLKISSDLCSDQLLHKNLQTRL